MTDLLLAILAATSFVTSACAMTLVYRAQDVLRQGDRAIDLMAEQTRLLRRGL
jgi:hypothetical protein